MASKYLSPLDECWENLANAIILQACQDYYEGVRYLKDLGIERCQYYGSMCFRIREYDYSEAFFNSSWFNFLTDINPLHLMETLETHAKHDMRHRKHRRYREDRASREEY